MTLESLNPEWERIEVLGHCLARGRNGQDIDESQIERLRMLQGEVESARTTGAWAAAAPPPLSRLEYDVLACTVAPEIVPRLAWMYQGLQPGAPQPHATPALMQELLSLEPTDAPALYSILDGAAPLQSQRLIRVDGDGPFAPVLPGAGVTDRLLERRSEQPAPPGTTLVSNNAVWEDLVLPPDRIDMIREFVFYLRHRERVVTDWGGAASGGPIGLFAGPSGTGKTFAASVLANDLGWPLYRVDLGRLVSKYIGETEKNLNALFDAAHGRSMILQFDEADSLFSKRGEVKEARDRYANMEVSHLLARVEQHQGPCILTTNLRSHLDKAFARRFQVVIDFPRPDAMARQRLWSRLLPPRAPRDADVDLALLAEAVSLSGGGIRNAALHAAYLAADNDRPIGLAQIALAAWRELGKEGRSVNPSELGALATHLNRET